MLNGESICLRPVRRADVNQLYAFHCDIDNRGDYFPRGILGQPVFDKQFEENGFWAKDEGMLVIEGPDEQICGSRQSPRALSLRDKEAQPNPVGDSPGQRGITPTREKMRIHA